MGKVLRFADDAHRELLEGIAELEKAVVSTYGPRGHTVILDNGTGHPIVTKDGVSVARFISFTNKWKDIGASIIKDAALRTNREAGDGTTLTTLLACELIKKGIELSRLGFDRIDIKKGFKEACDAVTTALDPFVSKIETLEDILHIATISANNDIEIGETIKQAFEGVGDDGVVSLLNSYNGKTVVKFSSGFELGKGYTTSAFANNKDDTYTAHEPSILLCESKIEKIEDIKPILDIASKRGSPLVIIAPYFDENVHAILVTNVEKKNLDCCCVYTPGFSNLTLEEYTQDISVVTGAKIFRIDQIDEFNPLTDFGLCGDIKITPEKTVFTEPHTDPQKLEEHCQKIRDKIALKDAEEETLSEMELGTLKERLAKLNGGVATIYIGADSAIEMKEKKDRYEDAINAVRAAIEEGIVPGGGKAFASIVHNLLEESNNASLADQTKHRAYEAFLEVLKIPALSIIQSSGIKDPYLMYEKVATSDFKSGFNAKNNTFEIDLIKEGVVDPVKVLKTALKYATSVASTFITTDTVITDDISNAHIVPNDKIMDEMRDIE